METGVTTSNYIVEPTKSHAEGPPESPTWIGRRDRIALLALRSIVHTWNPRSAAAAMTSDDALDLMGIQRSSGPGSRLLTGPSAVPPRSWFSERLAEVEADPDLETNFVFENLCTLSAELEFSRAERELLSFCVVLETEPGMEWIFSSEATRRYSRMLPVLSRVLDIPKPELQAVFSKEGFLFKSLILRWVNGTLHVDDRVLAALTQRPLTENGVFEQFFKKVGPGDFTVTDFGHVEKHVRILTDYLGSAIHSSHPGVNVLLYGAAGTGKSQLARAVAAAIPVSMYEVQSEDPFGGALGRKERQFSYVVAQRMLSRRPASLLLFDEAEDLFPRDLSSTMTGKSASSGDKGWINASLDSNRIPTLWICNRVDHIDEAVLRRFDYIAQLDAPRSDWKTQMIRSRLEPLGVEPSMLARLAAHPEVTPADVARAARVTAGVRLSETQRAEDVVELVVNGSLVARGAVRMTKSMSDQMSYRLSLLHTDCDIGALVDTMRRPPSGNICLYGPPGTGKTAFAHHLARQLDMTVQRYVASDLLDKFVGGTEKKIARMFETVDVEKEILLLDEADSFLRSRELAMHSWEVTHTNELLTQMESFEGLFICSTNLIDDFDPAAFRRFSLKVRFEALNYEQRVELLRVFCDELGISSNEQAEDAMRDLPYLVPGDMAAVRAKLRLVKRPENAMGLVALLANEHSYKREAEKKRRVGF